MMSPPAHSVGPYNWERDPLSTLSRSSLVSAVLIAVITLSFRYFLPRYFVLTTLLGLCLTGTCSSFLMLNAHTFIHFCLESNFDPQINNFLYSDLILKVWISKSSKACTALFWFWSFWSRIVVCETSLTWPVTVFKDTSADQIFHLLVKTLLRVFEPRPTSKSSESTLARGLWSNCRRIRGALVGLGPQTCRSASQAEPTPNQLDPQRSPYEPPVAWTFRTSERTTNPPRPGKSPNFVLIGGWI